MSRSRLFILLAALSLVFLGSLAGWRHFHQISLNREAYFFLNETDRHEHDLAFRMSLKLAESRSGIEYSLIFLKSLPPGQSISETANELFKKWQIGRRTSGKGVLIVYSEAENQMRIEVSYALEGVLPDAACRNLEESAKTFMLSEVPQDFVSELIITLNLYAMGSKEVAVPLSPPEWLNSDFLSGGGGAHAQGYHKTIEDLLKAIKTLPQTDLTAYLAQKDPEKTLELYLHSLESGLGDPRLPLLTEGSQIFRAIVPRNEAQQNRIYQFYKKGMPHRMYRDHGFAVAVFEPGTSNLPIVLRASTLGLWYIDEPKSWYYFHRFENDPHFFPKYENVPSLRKLREMHYAKSNEVVFPKTVMAPLAPEYPFSLVAAILMLEKSLTKDPQNDRNYMRLGDLYLYEMGWVKKSIQAYQNASRINPKNPLYHWRLWELYINHSEAEKALAELDQLKRLLPKDRLIARFHRHYHAAYRF